MYVDIFGCEFFDASRWWVATKGGSTTGEIRT
jgi:hypothetical protein